MKSFKVIDELVVEFINTAIKEPLIFFSEADLQSLLFKILTNRYKKNYQTSYKKGFDSKTNYKTSQIHREYGLNNMPNSRMDIVFFDKESIKQIDSPNLTIDGNYIDPIIGFELGTHKISDFTEHLHNDIIKLSKLKRGYLIYLMRDETISSPFTETGIKTEQWFKNNIETPLTKIDFPESIIPLIFYIKIQKKSTNIWGKCNLYNPIEKRFKRTPKESIKTNLLNYLNEI